MIAIDNSGYKMGWISSYYPYTYYINSNTNDTNDTNDTDIVLKGNETKVDNNILTKKIILDSKSGFSRSSLFGGNCKNHLSQESSRSPTTLQKKKDLSPTIQFIIKSNSVENALKQFEDKVRKSFKKNNLGKSELLVLDLESLDPKNKLVITKIYRKKI